MNFFFKSALFCAALGSTSSAAIAQEVLRAEIEFLTSGEGYGLIDTTAADFLEQYAINSIHNMGQLEFSDLVDRIIAAGGTITLSKKDQTRPPNPGEACLADKKLKKLLDEKVNGTEGKKFFFDTPKNVFDNFGIEEGTVYTPGEGFENFIEYNVAGIKGFKSHKGLTAAQQCNDDPECIRELGKYGTAPLKKPFQAKQISCLGATITDAKLIESISKLVEKTAKEKSDISKDAWDYGKFVTGITLEDIGIGKATGTAVIDLDKVPKPVATKIEALVETLKSTPVQVIQEDKIERISREEIVPQGTKFGLDIVLGF